MGVILLPIAYEIGCWLLALFSLPKMLYQMAVQGKYRESFLKRLGVDFPKIEKGNRQLVWIHAVSVGETKAIAALAKLLKTQMNNPMIVVSTVTETGHAEAQRSIRYADYHVFLPFDFYWIVRAIVRQAKPDLVVLSETDFWYHFLRQAKKIGAKVIVANGKLSQRSMSRFRWGAFFSRRLFGLIDLFCVQSNLYQTRFERIGISKDKIVVTGNLKFDAEYPRLSAEEATRWKAMLGVREGDHVLVIGSSHDPEEREIFQIIKGVWEEYPNLKVLLVPRHPERFNQVASLLGEERIPFVRLSQADSKKGSEKVVLIDTMGLLRQCYQIATLAIVGGSYTSRVGGHNIIEPSWYGVPVLFGPYMFSQPDLVELVSEYGAGREVTLAELGQVLSDLLRDPAKRSRFGEGGLKLASELQGATERTWAAMKQTLGSLTG